MACPHPMVAIKKIKNIKRTKNMHIQKQITLPALGLLAADLVRYAHAHPGSTLATLMARGVDFSNASTPFPSDSFPGMVGPVTGGNPSSTGIYYDDTWNHAVFPAGTTNCVGPAPGGEVAYTEAADINLGALDAGQGIVLAPDNPDPWED